MTVITEERGQRIECDECGLFLQYVARTEWERVIHEGLARVDGWQIGATDAGAFVFDDICPECLMGDEEE